MKTVILSLLFTVKFFFCAGQEKWRILRSEGIVVHAPFAQCHASTLVELSRGQLMAAWFGGSHEGAKDVCIWMSVYRNGQWGQPVKMAEGLVNDTLRYPCWNPVLFKNSVGKLFLFYKVGPSPREWWGMQRTSDDEGRSWSSPTRLPEGILGPIKNKPIQSGPTTIISPSSVEEAGPRNKWTAHIERSDDNGSHWQRVPLDTTGFDVIQPSILTYGNGKLQLLLRSKQGRVIQCWSEDNGAHWGSLSVTTITNPNSGIDAVTLRDGTQLIVYNPDSPGKEWYNGRAKLHVAVSKDGVHWEDVCALENGTKEEYSYPAVIQTQDGLVHITYTDDRKNIKHVVLSAP